MDRQVAAGKVAGDCINRFARGRSASGASRIQHSFWQGLFSDCSDGSEQQLSSPLSAPHDSAWAIEQSWAAVVKSAGISVPQQSKQLSPLSQSASAIAAKR